MTRSLSGRLLIGVISLVLLGLLVADGGTYLTFQKFLLDRLDSQLTNTEYRLLRYLLINAGRVLTRSQILDHVWHYDFGGDASVLETYVSYLRRKIDRHDPPLIQTVRGVGYVLRTPRK